MPPHHGNDEPARWRMVEATNGYDVDNGWFQDPPPVLLAPSAQHRSRRFGQAVGRRLLALHQRTRPVR
jgi:hypothetical protein